MKINPVPVINKLHQLLEEIQYQDFDKKEYYKATLRQYESIPEKYGLRDSSEFNQALQDLKNAIDRLE